MGNRNWDGANVHAGAYKAGMTPFIDGEGERVGVPKKTPAPNTYFGGPGSKGRVADGLTSGEDLLRGGKRPAGKVKS